MSDHLLTFEADPAGERLEIHMDSAGLDFLLKELQRLRDTEAREHAHLMSEDWGGAGLSGEKQNASAEQFKHVKIFKW